MTPLCKLAEKYGTDKFGYYSQFYDLLFRGRRGVIKKVVEVGIGTKCCMGHVENYHPGASIQMWRDYFPFADVFGLDRVDDVLITGERIYCCQCDQRSDAQLRDVADWIGNDVGLVVDDGSHQWQDQLRTVRWFWPRISDGGIYIIEDVNDPHEISEGLNKMGLQHAHVTICPQQARCCVIQK